MARLIGLDLSASPPTGAIIETSPILPLNSGANDSAYAKSSHSFTSSARCVSSFLLTPENLDGDFRESLLTADGSTAIIAPSEILELRVTLPFADKKRVAALLPQELEDLLPFPATDFAVGMIANHSDGNAGSAKAGRSKAFGTEHHFELQLVPKDSIKEALASLSSLGIDPNVVTTRSSLLVPVAEAIIAQKLTQHAELFGENQGCDSFFVTIPRTPTEVDILFVIENRIIHYQTLRAAILRPAHTDSENPGEPDRASLASAILLELGSISRRFSTNITTGFIVMLPDPENDDARLGDIPTLQRKDGIALAVIPIGDLLPNLKITAENASAVLGALCCLSDGARQQGGSHRRIPGSDPINFRRGEFSYRPPMTEVKRAGRRLIRPLLLTVGCAAVCGLGLFLFQAQEISYLENSIGNAVRAVAPQIVAEPGRELSALSEEAAKMELDLKDIGTSDNSSPLEMYAELTRHFPQLPDTTVDRVAIRGNRIEIRGCAPSYRVIEQIETALTKVKMFGKPKKGSSQSCSGAGSGARGFTFEVQSRE